MIDYELLIISVFALLFFAIIGGTILLFPLSRKLGHLIEARARRDAAPAEADPRTEAIAARLDALESHVAALSDRQEFLDRLMAGDAPPARALRQREE